MKLKIVLQAVLYLKHFRSTVQFMYSAVDSTISCTEGEASNGTVSSP